MRSSDPVLHLCVGRGPRESGSRSAGTARSTGGIVLEWDTPSAQVSMMGVTMRQASSASSSRVDRVLSGPTRPVDFVNVLTATPDVDVITDLFDVVMLNRYYGWYVDSGDLAAAERGLEAELEAWVRREAKPIILTEYGGDTLAGCAQRHADAVGRGVPGGSCSTGTTASSIGSTPSSVSRSGTSPTSPRDLGSCVSAATRRASSPATGARRRPRMPSANDGKRCADGLRVVTDSRSSLNRHH